ncbi:hypothetical protein [Flavobacterium sp. CF136]|uniref:hypothetical protein n=1 Tax=Flavobacterium sp. (strain CF136) TaxID=1144313 RepID=UPI0002716B9C|nr:hypothetical protein [Flavobacterium sp. CF136]EJL64075.1 hypothetical protein PMI10_02074 [Flavobacterium sp. CF136]
MIEDVLRNLAYLFYPKNIYPWDEKEVYLQTLEYKRLKEIIDSFDSDENPLWCSIASSTYLH